MLTAVAVLCYRYFQNYLFSRASSLPQIRIRSMVVTSFFTNSPIVPRAFLDTMSSAEEGSKTSEESSNDGAMTAARNHNRERQVSSTGESHRPPTVSTIASNTTSSTSCNNDTSPRSKSVKKDIHSAEADNSDKNEEKSENSDCEIAKYTSSSRTFMSNGDTKQQQNGTRDMDPRSDASNASTSRSRPKRRAASSVRFGSYRDIDAVDFSLLDSFRYDGDQRKSNRPSPSKISSKRNKPPSKSGTNTASLKRNSLIASSAQKSSSFKHLASAATRKTIGKNDAASSSTSTTKRNGGDGTSIASSNDLPGIYGLSSTFQNPTKRSKISGSELLKLLPPVLLTRTQDAGSSDDLTPSSLRHLVSKNNGLVDIFNRKTGMIMKGENAINIKDLASALRDHSEYEPIIPRSEEEILVSGGIPLKSGEYRQARTSVNGRISEVVLPQPTIRESKVEGRSVLITQGPHKGLFGK